MRSRFSRFLAVAFVTLFAYLSGFVMAQSKSEQFAADAIAAIKQSVQTYPAEKRGPYTRGLREGIDTCLHLLPGDQADQLAKHPQLRDLLDYLDKN